MNSQYRVDLAHEPSFPLGRLTVVPPYRELLRDDGKREVLEHRVMQVLIAMAKTGGDIVTRDELTTCCWDGRIVGEDAINRVIGRLRKSAGGIGDGSFRIETISKVGYRLISDDAAGSASPSTALPAEPAAGGWAPGRRTVLGGTFAAGLAAVGVGGWLYRDVTRPVETPEAEALLAQAWSAWAQGTSEGNLQAIGLYRRVIEAEPDHADGWGFMSCAYGDRAHHWCSAAERPVLRERARAAGRRALQIDPKHALGRAGIAYAQPTMGNWLEVEREFLRADRDQPGHWLMTYSIALLFMRVGRLSEATALFDRLDDEAPTATQYFHHIQASWGAGELEQAERLLGEAEAIYAPHPMIWYSRFHMLMHGGRANAALALAQDLDGRPTGVAEQDLDRALDVARAKISGDAAAAEAIMAEQTRWASEGAWKAIDAIRYGCELGRVDEAFAIAEAYFFSRGFTVPDRPPVAGQGVEVTLNARDTRFMFLPCVEGLRADPRFGRLVRELGLERYWREAGVQPDFRRV